jgi:tetratricopeptide (TPR) repeat protein
MSPGTQFPTPAHEQAFWEAVEFFKNKKSVLAITLGGSVMRGQGSYDADVDIDVFVKDEKEINDLGKEFDTAGPEIVNRARKQGGTGRFFDIGLHLRLLDQKPHERSWTTGPDEYEIELGHSFVYCKLIFERNGSWTKSREKYFPYYDEDLRMKRLKEITKYCLNNIEHIEPYVKRGLYLQALKRFHNAIEEFLQALFISRKVYPIDYDKWVKYELTEILKLSKLYKEIVSLYEIKNLESNELIEKGARLTQLFNEYIK